MQKNKRCPCVLLVDDFPELFERVKKLLRNDYEIVSFARDGGEALELCVTLNPDILLLDTSMPVLCGLEVATRLKELRCRSKIIFVSVQEDRDYIETAFSLGVLKCRIRTDLLPAIEAAFQHRTSHRRFKHTWITRPERRQSLPTPAGASGAGGVALRESPPRMEQILRAE